MYKKAKIIEIYTVSAILRGIHRLLLHYCKSKTGVINSIKRGKTTKKAPKQGVPVKNLTPAVKNLINPANKKFYGKIKFMD